MILQRFLLIFIMMFSLFIGGCKLFDERVWANVPYEEDNLTSLRFAGHIKLCEESPNDMFCEPRYYPNDKRLIYNEVMEVVYELASNFTYKDDKGDDWSYNTNVSQRLKNDCDGVMLSIIYHLIHNMSVRVEDIALSAKLYDGDKWHVFVAFKPSDREYWVHLDYGNSGQKLEKINYHMPFEYVGVYSWEKGNP